MTKLKRVYIKGIRGVKSDLLLPLDGNSVLLYGDNGSGKSSITDAIEWFFLGKIEHLSGEEIGRGGLDAIRNTLIDEKQQSCVSFEFTSTPLNSTRTITRKKEKLTCTCDNKSKEFENFIEASRKENLLLRYQDLMNFVLATKTEKLNDFSEIIGYAEVKDTRYILAQTLNEIKRDIKTKNFDDLISRQQASILEKLGQNITSDEQFIETVNVLLKSLGIEKRITSINEVDNVLQLIPKLEDSTTLRLLSLYNRIDEASFNFQNLSDVINEEYEKYYSQYHKIISDIETSKKIMMENLLSEGVKVLESEKPSDNKCPLCLQPKNREDLLRELGFRIEELKIFKNKKLELERTKVFLEKTITESITQIDLILKDKDIENEENKELKSTIQGLRTYFGKYLTELAIEVSPANAPKSSKELLISKPLLIQISNLSKGKVEQLEKQKQDPRFVIHSKIEISRNSYLEIRRLSGERKLMEGQQHALELILREFVKKQKEGLESFLTYISNDVNEIYQFMHPDEKVEGIKLSLMEDKDELVGITIEFTFFKNAVTPPQKYLSESHLNCLGIALFLASVKTFNKNNNFFVLDDIISSFDTGHRKRFADLLIERYSDYQIILLTHEKHWFDIVYNLVKGRHWMVNTIRYSVEKGTYLDEPPVTLKERIEGKIRENDEVELGNEIRKYLENMLKTVAENLEVKVKYLPNDKNEERMSSELLRELKSKLNKHKCPIKDNPLIDRMTSSVFIGNRDSHDNPVNPALDDFKALWKDVTDLEGLFLCPSCKRFVSLKNYDTVGKKVRCNCGNVNYAWKEE